MKYLEGTFFINLSVNMSTLFHVKHNALFLKVLLSHILEKLTFTGIILFSTIKIMALFIKIMLWAF